MLILFCSGFIGNDSQYNDMIDQGLADNFEDSLSGLGVDITTVCSCVFIFSYLLQIFVHATKVCLVRYVS